MAQVQSQVQTQRQEQRINVSLQQLQCAKLLEMPIGDFEQSVKKEIVENPALEEGRYGEDDATDIKGVDSPDEMEQNDTGDDPYSDDSEDFRNEVEQELKNYDTEDLPVYAVNNGAEERNELPLGDSGSFIEYLESQIMNYDLDDTQQQIMHYLIGLLDNRGFISTDIYTIVEELAFQEYLYVEEKDVEGVLAILQSFDPPGIGARNTQECLLLQIDRQLNNPDEPISEHKERFLMLQREVIANHYDLFLNKNKEGLKQRLHVNEVVMEAIFEALKKLNVNPGLSLGEASSARVQTLIPDFIVETDPDGNITIRLNNGEIPRLHVRPDYIRQLKQYLANPGKMSRGEKEGMLYTKQKVEAAQMFIESIKQRRRTLFEVMSAIIKLQKPFILSRDENDKVRMVLKDVASASGYDISTVSRVCNSKCAMIDGRIYRLSEFFKLTRKNADGIDVDGNEVAQKLKAIIASENKEDPYSDEQLSAILEKQGVKLARRTIAKYRKELGIPQVADRKQ